MRELQEELGLDVSAQPFTYLGSFPNIYPYDGITYHTCDTFFAIVLSEKPVIQPADDVAACQWLKICDIPLSRFAFESTRTAMARLQQSPLQA